MQKVRISRLGVPGTVHCWRHSSFTRVVPIKLRVVAERHVFVDCFLAHQSRFSKPASGSAFSFGRVRSWQSLSRGHLPSSHYYLGSLSRTSRTFYFPDSRDLLEVLGGLPWQRERPQGGSPRVREDPLGTPPSLSAKKFLREPREGPENLGRRRVPEVRDTEPN